MKKFVAALIITLCLVWGCATLNPQNARMVINSTSAAHSVAMTIAKYLETQDRLSESEIRRIAELDQQYRDLDQIVREAITAWETALTVSKKEGAEKLIALNNAIAEFTKVALELNNFIQELKSAE